MLSEVQPYAGDTQHLRQVFGAFPSGVAALAAMVDGTPTVLIASSFTVGVSQDPPLTLFSVQRQSTTWPELANASTIGVSILGSGHDVQCRQLAAKDKSARFNGVDWVEAESGAIFIDNSPVWLETTVEHKYPAGDHDIIVLRVLATHHDTNAQPLVFHRSTFHALA